MPILSVHNQVQIKALYFRVQTPFICMANVFLCLNSKAATRQYCIHSYTWNRDSEWGIIVF